MTAVIADELSAQAIEGIIGGLTVDIANINSTRQIVLSGEAGAIAEAESRLQAALDAPSLRFVRLKVSAPFHSRLLEPICAPFTEILREWGGGFDPERAGHVVSNYRGGFHSGGREEIIESLALQISHTVQWKQNMTLLASQAGAIWEIGPGRPLRDFFRTVGVACTSVTTLASAEKAFSAAD
jgi:[acyl-carrier-protein] S-malonyltransferase